MKNMKRHAVSAKQVVKHQRVSMPHEVRIIGGAFKRTKLPVADKPGLRPTPDRVRETLFNWLGQDLSGWRCLDAFAGSGALGFEAASRGARVVRLVDSDAELVARLQQIQTQLKADRVQVLHGNGLTALRQTPAQALDLVFLDPPFGSDLFEVAVVEAARAVTNAGFVYLEAPTRWTDERLELTGFRLYRYLKAGAVHAHLLKRLGVPVGQDNDQVVTDESCMP